VGYDLGIDLGGSSVAAAIATATRVEMIALGEGAVGMPAVVHLGEDGTLQCGDSAVRLADSQPARIGRELKRRLSSPAPVQLGDRSFTAPELLGEVLQDVVTRVSETVGSKPDSVVLTCPAHWNSARRDAFGTIGRAAGLSAVRTVTEPEAVAVHYAATERIADGTTVAVYDLGGGTFDATVLRRDGDRIEIIGAPDGIERLGGGNFDEAILSFVNKAADNALAGLDMRDPQNAAAVARLRQECTRAKEALSTDTETTIDVVLPNRHLDVPLTRSEFEGMIRTPIETTIMTLIRTLQSAQVEPSELAAIVLVGGSSRIPLVSKMISDALARPIVLDEAPEHAVALGAATSARGATPSNTAGDTDAPGARSGSASHARMRKPEDQAAGERAPGDTARVEEARVEAARVGKARVGKAEEPQPTALPRREPQARESLFSGSLFQESQFRRPGSPDPEPASLFESRTDTATTTEAASTRAPMPAVSFSAAPDTRSVPGGPTSFLRSPGDRPADESGDTTVIPTTSAPTAALTPGTTDQSAETTTIAETTTNGTTEPKRTGRQQPLNPFLGVPATELHWTPALDIPPSDAPPAPPAPGSGARKRTTLITVAAVLTALLLGVGYFAWDRFSGGGPGTAAPPATAQGADAPAAPDQQAGGQQAAVARSVPNPTVSTTVQIGDTPGFVVVSPDGRQAMIAGQDAGVITVLDTATNKVTATIPVDAGPPQYLSYSPDGSKVYVSIWNQARTIAAVGVLDTATETIDTTIPVRTRPYLSAVTPDGTRLYVPNHDSGTISVIDTGTNKVRSEITVAPNPHWVEMSQDGTRAYVANHESNLVSVIDTSNDDILAEVPVQTSPHSLAVNPTRPLVANVNYDAATVTMIDTNTDKVTAAITVGKNPQDITWAPDGRYAYVVNTTDSTVSVIDAETAKVTATIPTGASPTSVTVLPDGTQAYISNLRGGTVTVLDIDG
jgi:YVTN family beta-propeller protein